MKKALFIIPLICSVYSSAMSIDDRLTSIQQSFEKINKTLEFLTQKSLHTFWPYFIVGPATCYSTIKLISTPFKSENTREIIKYTTYSVIGFSVLSGYSWLQLNQRL